MKQKLIKLSETHYIIVDDSEIREGDKSCYCYNSIKGTWNEDIILYQGTMPPYHYRGFKKITHSTQPLNKEFNDWFDAKIITLSEVEEAINGDSVEKMAEDYVVNHPDFEVEGFSEYQNGIFNGYIEGFKAHQELVKDKLFIRPKGNEIKQITREEANFVPHFQSLNGEFFTIELESIFPKIEWDIEFDEQDKLRLI